MLTKAIFSLLLGYPGRTFRNRPSKYYEYRENFVLPYVSELYDWVIEQALDLGKDNPGVELALSSTVKGYANVMKKYKGQLKGFRKLNLVKQKKHEEEELIKFINSDDNLSEKYGYLFTEINQAYSELNKIAKKDLWLEQLTRVSNLSSVASGILTRSGQKQESKPVSHERENSFIARMQYYYNSINLDLEKRVINKMIEDAKNFDEKLNH